MSGKKSDQLDLDFGSSREPGDLDGGSGGRGVVVEVPPVDSVDGAVFTEVRAEDGDLDDIAQRRACAGEDGHDIVQDASGLRPDVPGDQLTGGRVEGELPRTEEETTRGDRLGIGSDRGRGAALGVRDDGALARGGRAHAAMLHQRPMRLATWNINSVKARGDRLLRWLENERPDVLCLQELKGLEEIFPAVEVRALGYEYALNAQKTYNGVAILAREKLEDVTLGMGDEDAEEDTHARLISAKVRGVTIYCAYFPNGGKIGSDKYAYKLRWMDRLHTMLKDRHDLAEERVLLCGDYNVAPFDNDVARPEEWGGGVLTSAEVRERLVALEALGLQDVFRPFHPEGGVHTWWDYRGRGFERGNGLRIDHVFVTKALAPHCLGAAVDRRERHPAEGMSGPSDHAPVVVEFDI